MSSIGQEIGNLQQKNLEAIRVEWEIPEFFRILEDEITPYYKSPTFLFAQDSWYFGIKFHSYMVLELCNDEPREYAVEYNYGIKKVDGTVEAIGEGIMEGHETCDNSDDYYYMLVRRTELQEKESDLVPLGVFTITCTLKRENTESDQQKALDKPKTNKLIRLDILSENFKGLFSNKESCDVTLHVVDKEFKAHKAVLIARSFVFASMFQHPMSEKKTGVINIEDCDPCSFEQFLEFLYSGKLEEVSFCSALHLYETANKYNVEELKEFCGGYLKENLAVENACDAIILADKYDDTALMSSAQNVFNENSNEIFETTEWECLLKHNYRLANKLLKAMPRKKISK